MCRTDAGLATVMGHEIGHAGASRRRALAQQQLVASARWRWPSQFRDLDMASQQRVLSVLAAGANVGVLLPFSRRHESEADKIGLTMMATAGYDPAEASEFWKRMRAAAQKAGSRQGPGFLSTHPDHERRAADLRRTNDVEPLYARSPHQPGSRPLPEFRSRFTK